MFRNVYKVHVLAFDFASYRLMDALTKPTQRECMTLFVTADHVSIFFIFTVKYLRITEMWRLRRL
jgi:hypothetical protein